MDFRSDTVTRPTPEMLSAMMAAKVGDDVFGEDPTINELESKVARLLGKEAALFTPSGTMANQIAIHLQTRPGDSIIAEAESHVAMFEAGGAASLSGVHFDFVPRDERLSDAAIDRALKPDSMHHATTRMIEVENTHLMAGGRVLRIEEVRRIIAKGRAHGLSLHLDGARLWNAAAALGVAEKELALGFDTVAVCFSKGLGAPVGSALCGTRELIGRARKIRKRWGGAMRQAGFLAAAAIYALDHHRERLKDDHLRAARLAARLQNLSPNGMVSVHYPDPGTNLIFFRLAVGDADGHVRRLAEAGLLVTHIGQGWLRAVTHLDVGDEDVERAADAVAALAKALS